MLSSFDKTATACPRSASCIPFLSTSVVVEGIFQQSLPTFITMKTTLLGNIILTENPLYLELGLMDVRDIRLRNLSDPSALHGSEGANK